ncbi:hypothetical protein THAOC_08029 [Thalassiosira oceanica]|uniref:Uncharacterized protein n=1 Tax=Thalassiosira oceanica TaxID=159749 RepID=K0TAX7_THAOC|nr:hypothetical protein THAOC_08029 [Thalassiosira oceanica]|eukprot:EJK70601.1 hypothetical protein THAOC_08029 [Thalassiosira oceanica]
MEALAEWRGRSRKERIEPISRSPDRSDLDGVGRRVGEGTPGTIEALAEWRGRSRKERIEPISRSSDKGNDGRGCSDLDEARTSQSDESGGTDAEMSDTAESADAMLCDDGDDEKRISAVDPSYVTMTRATAGTYVLSTV